MGASFWFGPLLIDCSDVSMGFRSLKSPGEGCREELCLASFGCRG